MTAGLAYVCVGMAVAMVAMAIRMSGLQKERNKHQLLRDSAERTSAKVSTELRSYQKVAELQRVDLLEDIERLEDDLQNCNTPGSVRERLRTLAKKAQARPSDPA